MSTQATNWKKIIAITGTMAAGAWVMLLYRPSSNAGVRRRPPVAIEALAPLEASPFSPPSAVEASEQTVTAAPTLPPVALSPQLPSAEVMKRNGQLVAAQVNLLEQVMTETGSDVGAGRAEKLLHDAYAASDFGGATFTASCRATLCRIAMEPGPNEGAKASIQHLSSYAPWSAPGFTQVDLATERTTLYIAREGHELPMVHPTEEVQ